MPQYATMPQYAAMPKYATMLQNMPKFTTYATMTQDMPLNSVGPFLASRLFLAVCMFPVSASFWYFYLGSFRFAFFCSLWLVFFSFGCVGEHWLVLDDCSEFLCFCVCFFFLFDFLEFFHKEAV